MIKGMPKRRKDVILLFLIFIIALTLITINVRGNKNSAIIESVIISVISPFQSIVTKSINKISNIWNMYIYLVNVREENVRLKKEIDELREENNRYIEQNLRYKRLKDMLAFKEKGYGRMVMSEVVGFDPTGWSHLAIIDKGTRNGVKKGMPVLTHEGLVGHIIQSTPKFSKVLLITDVKSAVDVIVQRTRSSGVIVGNNKNICEMKYLAITADIEIMDKVISSGLGGIFPKGVIIGIVSAVRKEKYGLFQKVEVTPAANLSQLEEVFVITGN